MYGWAWYGTKSAVSLHAGHPSKDGMLSHLYFKLKEEGTVAQTFCGERKNLDSFIAYFDRLKTLQVLCLVSDSGILRPVGFSWVDNPRGVDGARTCMCGEAFFDGAGRTPAARGLARLALAYAFHDLRIDVLHGVQVVDNIAARNFSMRLGFKECAIVPDYHAIDGKLVDARVMILRKSEFWPGFVEWKERQPKVESVLASAEQSLRPQEDREPTELLRRSND